MRRVGRLYLSVLSLELRNLMAYRVDFWIRMALAVMAQLTVAFFLWDAIFTTQKADSIGGYSFFAMILYYFIAALVRQAVSGLEIGYMSRDIYEGRLTKYLVYPVSFFGYKCVAYGAYTIIFMVQLLIGLGVIYAAFGFPADVHINGVSLGLGVAACFFAAYLRFVIGACIEMVSFWIDNTWTLMLMFVFTTTFLGGGLLPLALFPGWAQELLFFLPFPYLIHFPVTAFMGEVTFFDFLQAAAITVAWSIVFTMLARVIWNRGTREYAGVGI
ncbi:ABC-2 family transporter protein [Oligoflexia bacterium]|nr:ABC-2 family transporter protein [Oligoflexia bacterium]